MYRNNEHYPDPTFASAYANIRRQAKTDPDWVYIASPYRGDIKRNMENAKNYAAFAVRRGKMPMCPHIYFTQFLNDAVESEREIGLNLALQMLKRCKEIWVFGEYISCGMNHEIRMAQKWNIPVRNFNEMCEEVMKK